MTYKEAKKAIEAIIFCAENMTIECDGFNDCRKNCKGYVTYEEERESYSVAIEALEKQEELRNYIDAYRNAEGKVLVLKKDVIEMLESLVVEE